MKGYVESKGKLRSNLMKLDQDYPRAGLEVLVNSWRNATQRTMEVEQSFKSDYVKVSLEASAESFKAEINFLNREYIKIWFDEGESVYKYEAKGSGLAFEFNELGVGSLINKIKKVVLIENSDIFVYLPHLEGWLCQDIEGNNIGYTKPSEILSMIKRFTHIREEEGKIVLRNTSRSLDKLAQ